MTLLTPENAHAELSRSAAQRRNLTEEDVLLWMVLLHTHEIHLRSDAFAPQWQHAFGEVVKLAAHTQRGVASAAAALWATKRKQNLLTDERVDYVYWYYQYNTRVPYEIIEDVPDEHSARLQALRDLLAQDPRVVAIVPEE